MALRRVYAEQIKYELESRVEDTSLSQISLMSFPQTDESVQINFEQEFGGQQLCPLSKEVISEYKNEYVREMLKLKSSYVVSHATLQCIYAS